MAHVPWRPWLFASALVALAIPSAAARAQEDPSANTIGDVAVDTEAAAAVSCVTIALRVAAAEVNGVRRVCTDNVTHQATTTVTFSTPPDNGAPVTYTPLPADQGSDAANTPDPQP